MVSGIAFYGAAAELLNELYKKVGAARCGSVPMPQSVQVQPAQVVFYGSGSNPCCCAGDSPACFSLPSAPPCALQTVLPLGVCNPGAAILPLFQSAVGAIPLLGPMYLR